MISVPARLRAAAVAVLMMLLPPLSPSSGAADGAAAGQSYFEMPRMVVMVRDNVDSDVYDVFHRLVEVQVVFVVNGNLPLMAADRRPELKRAMEAAVQETTFRRLREENGAVLIKEKMLAAGREVLGADAVDEVLVLHLNYR